MPEHQKTIYFITGELLAAIKDLPEEALGVLLLVDLIDKYAITLLGVFDSKILVYFSKEGLELEEMRRERKQIRLVAIDEGVSHLLIQNLQIWYKTSISRT
jgi:molecular chaperone HtpG